MGIFSTTPFTIYVKLYPAASMSEFNMHHAGSHQHNLALHAPRLTSVLSTPSPNPQHDSLPQSVSLTQQLIKYRCTAVCTDYAWPTHLP